MNYNKIAAALGVVLTVIGVSMVLPLLWSLYYGEHDWPAFLICSGLTTFIGIAVYKTNRMEEGFNTKEAFAVVSFSWLLAAAFGSLPYLLSGTFTSFADALFETMSGLTTTGASVLTDIEILPHGILFWRSLTHWLGGMGIIVLFVAILSTLGVGGLQMFKAESPGPTAEKIKPRIRETAKILWYTYLSLTAAETLLLLAFGMPLFDALCHTFGTMATGGFSTKNASIGFYSSPWIHWIITIFMFLAGVNFALHYQVFRGRSLKAFWRNAEFRLYAFLTAAAVMITAANLAVKTSLPFESIVRQASFQVVSIMTTTGYATADFDGWPLLSKALLVALMFIGGCSGSTGGSIKVGRILILIKQAGMELKQSLHPRAVMSPKIDGKSIGKEVLINTQEFFFIYVAIIGVSTGIMAALGLDLGSAFTAVIASLGNIGPGLGKVGPVQNYNFISSAGKYYLSFLMMLGRLELYTVLVLFLPSFWRR